MNHLGRPSKLISKSGRLENLSRYGFPSLPSGQHIRVLLLSPARRWGHPLHGYLQVQDLNGRPHYEALSYTWSDESGDASLNRHIYIGPAWDVMPITRSCSQALRRLRLDEIIRPFWVDAVCINQLNNSEKSNQIALMRRIYTKSIRCLVDLGEPSTESDSALDRVNGMAGKEDYVPVSGQPLNHGDALNTLFHRPYFRRIWIIQEITSAPQAEITCGSRSTDLRLLRHFSSVKPPWMAIFEKQIDTFRSEGRYEGPEGLLRLLVDTKESESSDPRDKIFALLGLMKDHQTNSALVADYDLTYMPRYARVWPPITFNILGFTTSFVSEVPACQLYPAGFRIGGACWRTIGKNFAISKLEMSLLFEESSWTTYSKMRMLFTWAIA